MVCGTSASTRPRGRICGRRSDPGRRAQSSRCWSAAPGTDAPTGAPRREFGNATARRSLPRQSSAATPTSRCIRAEAERRTDSRSAPSLGLCLHDPRLMEPDDDARPRWPYYAAIVLFVAVLAFAVLGLVRSSTLAGVATRKEVVVPNPTPTPSLTLQSG